MTRDFLGRGWSFPVRVDKKTGKIEMSEYEKDIAEAIRIILSTRKGERPMQPDFGCGIHEYVFAVINMANLGLVESEVRDALTRWEARIEALEVKACPDEANPETLAVDIRYRVCSTNNQYNLVYSFYIREG